MKTKRKIISLVIGIIIFCFISFQYSGLAEYLRWQNAVKAASAFPYQIGLTKVAIIKCFTTGTPPICEGGLLCYTKDPATCTAYSDVSGAPAGGMGSNALFSNLAMAKAGLTPGGQLISGGMSPVLMDNGVLASAGGCYGCYAKAGIIDNFLNFFDYIIAGFKE